jgi:hypothetical protein
MGASLHWSGSLGSKVDLTELVEELLDIARSMRWKAQRIERDAGNPEFRGVILQPDDSTESLPFLFDREGRLRSLADLICRQFFADPRCSYLVSVKTQFGKLETHLWIVSLLRYLKSEYLPDLEVSDEGGYWETGDVTELDTRRKFLDAKIAEFAKGFSMMESGVRTADELISEIEEYFLRRKPD